MTARRLILAGTACCAILSAAPAVAQEMGYEERTYEYPQPAQGSGEVIYRQQPVVQPVPAYPARPTYTSQPVVQPVPEYADEYEVEYEHANGHVRPAPAPMPHHGAHAPMPHHGAAYPYPPRHAGPALPADFDRDAWLADCREGYRNNRGRRSGGVGGGILGAAVGGVIGNRVADGNRLAGTLIGAGVGGLAGLAIGSAIGASGDRRRAREACEAWLDNYMAGGYRQHGGHYGYPHGYGYGYGYAMHMTYVPVLVAVPQRAIIRETVTEEWVKEPSYTYEYVPAKTKRVKYRKAAPAPQPVKRVKYRK